MDRVVQDAHLDSDQSLHILCMCLLCLQVPEDNSGLGPVRPSEGVHHSASKVAPLVIGLHIGKVYKGLHC